MTDNLKQRAKALRDYLLDVQLFSSVVEHYESLIEYLATIDALISERDRLRNALAESLNWKMELDKVRAENASIEATTARRCAEIVHTGIGYYDDPDYACTDLKNAILREFKLEPK